MKNESFLQAVSVNPALQVLAASRSVLMLQGPVGPFFDRLTRWLKNQGVTEVNRVVFSGGDQWDCSELQPFVFDDNPTMWPLYLQNLLRNYKVDCLVLFGQGRPHHCKAMVLASLLGVQVVVLEEGYFRPGYITMELGGVNGYSSSLDLFQWQRPVHEDLAPQTVLLEGFHMGWYSAWHYACTTEAPIPILEVNDKLARKLQGAVQADVFSAFQKTSSGHSLQIAAGDSLEVTIWEAPPAMLFGGSALEGKGQSNGSRSITLPEQMIGKDSFIQVPFAGMVSAVGRPLTDIEEEIKQRLKGKANQPQVMLRVTKNVTSNATVVGEVKQSLRLPLTAKGERVMDALAASGGVTQAVGKITLQLSRGGESKQLPMQRLIEDPAQNISLEPGDVVTALYQPLSFTVLGATGKNEEINFEAQGISLAQGLARAGGLQDQRADAQGVFVFRFEEPVLVESTNGSPLKVTAEGKVPVVYRVDMKDPRAFLAAQNFPLRNKDLIYVSNAPAAELQKFLNILTSSIFSISNLVTLTK